MRQRALIAIGIIALAILAARDLERLHDSAPWKRTIDLPEFYCAGAAVAHRQDPYLAATLRPCEHAIRHGGDWNYASYVVPAPQPPFDFLPYVLLSRMPYADAQIAATLLIGAALLATAWVLSRLGVPFVAAFAALALSDAFVGAFTAQIYPFELLLVTCSALALSRHRDALAGIAGALTLIEPQIGIGICLVLLIWAPKTRPALVASAIALTLAGIAAVGIGPAIEWATQVIPAQAHAEATFWAQYSLTSILTSVGVGAPAAELIGSISYVAMLLLSVFLIGRYARTRARRELFVLLPAAFSVVAGTYVHLDAIPAAVPLALVFATGSYGMARYIPIAILVLLAVPWLYAQEFKPLFFSCLLCVALICAALKTNVRQTTAFMLASAAGLYAIALHTPPPLSLVHETMPANGATASEWIVATAFDPWRTAAKAPTWIGLLGLVGTAFYALRGRWETMPP